MKLFARVAVFSFSVAFSSAALAHHQGVQAVGVESVSPPLRTEKHTHQEGAAQKLSKDGTLSPKCEEQSSTDTEISLCKSLGQTEKSFEK